MPFQDVLEKKKTKGGFGSILNKPTLGLGPKPDIATPQGLQQMARQSGLSESTQRILASKGEKPEEIFSGGFISDIFDSLNALQYGTVGLLKGKSFMEGVETRESFTKKDALGDKGIPGLIGGIALDIAVDPLTYIPVIGWGAKLLGGLKKAGMATAKVAGKIPVIDNVGDV